MERGTDAKAQIISLFIGVLISTCLVYFLLIPTLVIIIIPTAAIMFLISSFLGSLQSDYEKSDEHYIIILFAVIIGIMGGAVFLVGNMMFAEDLNKIPHVTEIQNGSAKEIYILTPGSGTLQSKTGIGTIGEEIVSTNHIRTVPKEAAEWKSSKSVGDFGYKFEARDAHVQFRGGEIKWLVPLEYETDYKAWVYGGGGIDGYISVSAENAQKAPEKVLGFKMKYVPSGVFKYNLNRLIYLKYPDYYRKENVFQLNDAGTPIYVTMLTRPTKGYTGEIPEGIVVTNTETGTMVLYDMENIPSYINRVMDESLTENYLAWWGIYIHGFWNTVFSQKEMRKPTGGLTTTAHEGGELEIRESSTPDVYLVYGTDNRLYWFATITTVGEGMSMVGYTLTDILSGNSSYYKTEGYYNDISAAKNVQQHADVSKVMGYRVSQPIMYVLFDEETWIIPVLASTNEVKAFGIVHAKSGTTFVRDRLADALTDYRGWLTGAISAPESTQTVNADVVAILVVRNEPDIQEIPIYKNTTIVIKGRDS